MTGMERDPDAARWLEADEPAPPGDHFWSGVEMNLRAEADTGSGRSIRPSRMVLVAAVAALIVAVSASAWFISDRGSNEPAVAAAPIEVFGDEPTPVVDAADEDSTDEAPVIDDPPVIAEPPCLHKASSVDDATSTEAVCVLPGHAPDGLFATARAGAGELITIDDGLLGGLDSYRAIPVFDAPEGEPRVLDYEFLDGSLMSQTYAGGFGLAATSPLSGNPLVLRVLELDPSGQWLRVQSPSRPKHRSVWVRATDFQLGQTTRRVEVDVADNRLRLYEGDKILLDVSVVSGRAERPTTLQQAWVEESVDGFNEAYGPKVLRVATWSDAISTFSGGLPRQLIHGTNTPELLGQRVTSSSIRVENDAIEELARLAIPGTPVVFFDSRDAEVDRDAISAITITEPAPTVPFAPALPAPGVLWLNESNGQSVSLPAEIAAPQIDGASICPSLHPHLLPDEADGPRCLAPGDVKPGLFATGLTLDSDEQVILPVFDEPGGQPRTLVFEYVDGSTIPHPLANPTFFGTRPVLRVLELDQTGQWLRVQAPTRINERSVWVRSQDFLLGRNDTRLEADVGTGVLRLFRGDVAVLEAPMSSGRAERPTPLVQGWIRYSIPGPSETYGPVVFAFGAYSDAINTFSGGLPELSVFGPRQSEDNYSSGGLRTEIATMEQMAMIAVPGTPVIIYDSRSTETDREAIIARRIDEPAATVPFDDVGATLLSVPS